jgi:PAS domain S-box-containing protein
MMSFSTLQTERVWPGELIQKLRLISDVIANALARKHLSSDLRSAEQKIQDLLAFAYDWEYWENHDRTLHQMTPSCMRVTGYEEREFLNNPELIQQIIHPEDLSSWEALFHEPDAHPEGLELKIRVRHRNGEFRWINHSRRPILDDHGALSGFHVRNRDVTEHKQKENKLQEQQGEIQRLTKQLKKESSVFIREYALQFVHEEIIGRSQVMKEVLAKVEQVARTDSTVLIQGETGTGKELLAGAIHKLSMRKDKSMITVNCACLPPTLMESELFGREKGAYTGALTRMVGRFELADHSTIFLDEIGELPLDLQSKLLRVLQEGRFERLGSGKTQQVDVRIIAATNRNLEQMVNDGLFRKDLYYRLKVFPIDIPALRDRSEDIPLLVWAMVKELEPKIGKSIDSIPPKTLEALERYAWPGNVRELRNVIEYGMIISKNNTLTVNLPNLDGSPQPAPDNKLLEDIERIHISSVLEKTGWRISGPMGAAEILGIKRTTLQSKIKKLGIKRPGS